MLSLRPFFFSPQTTTNRQNGNSLGRQVRISPHYRVRSFRMSGWVRDVRRYYLYRVGSGFLFVTFISHHMLRDRGNVEWKNFNTLTNVPPPHQLCSLCVRVSVFLGRLSSVNILSHSGSCLRINAPHRPTSQRSTDTGTVPCLPF